MKKRQLAMSILLAGLLLGLSACGNSASKSGQDSPAPQENVAEAQETESQEQEEETVEETADSSEPEQAALESTEQEDAADAATADTTVAEASADEEGAPKSNTLVVYFSRVGNTDFPEGIDADSSASIRVGDSGLMGNAGQIAAWIAEEAGCETMEILTEEPYPADYNETVNQAKQEQNEGFRPLLKADEKAVEDYDTIYLVFPNWWGDLPMPVYSFLDAYDLAGKTVNVFVTHEGSRFSSTVGTIAELEPDAGVQEGLAVQGGSVSDEEQNIRQWVIDHRN
ncbi:MAG: flavodoxin [Eubacteriales bacterium]|nr:flavodoxin [Eubacteriales bacterium]